MIFFNRDFWAKSWSVPLYMGYRRKVESTSFPMVVVSNRTSHFIARNLSLKMGFFQTKNCRYWTTPRVNSTKKLGIIGPLEVYRMVYLNFRLKKLFRRIFGKFQFSRCVNMVQLRRLWCGNSAPKNSNTLDLFYSKMDLSIAIIKLGSNFLTFPTIV